MKKQSFLIFSLLITFLITFPSPTFAATTAPPKAYSLTEHKKIDNQNKETANLMEIYSVPFDTSPTFRWNIYKAKVDPEVVKKGITLITSNDPEGSKIYTFIVTDVYNDTAELLLLRGPKKEVSLFTPLIELSY